MMLDSLAHLFSFACLAKLYISLFTIRRSLQRRALLGLTFQPMTFCAVFLRLIMIFAST